MLPGTDIANISDNLYHLAFHIQRRIFNPAEMLKGLHIPPSNMRVIFHLVKTGPCPVSKIADDLLISRSNMTPIIDNLIGEGFVNRYNSSGDRRVIMVEATEKALSFLSNREQNMKNLLVEKLSVLDDEDLKSLKELLPQINKVITKMK